MIRQIISVIAMLMLVVISLVGCDYTQGESIDQDVQIEYSDFDLVVDSKTKIVYIDNRTLNANGSEYHSYTPYYSKNGNLCRFVDGKIVEVENEQP